MSDMPQNEAQDPVMDLLAEVRGDQRDFSATDWSSWSGTLGEWVEAYPAFGAGRLLRAKAAREGRELDASERLVQAAVFASIPGRLFDVLFRAGIESEIAAFARAVEALEPEVESEMRLRWHPDVESSVEASAAVEPVTESEEAGPEEARPKEELEEPEEALHSVDIPEEGTLAREVVLGAIERSIERELDGLKEQVAPEHETQAEAEAPVEKGQAPSETLSVDWGAVEPAEPKPVDVAALSPLARWAYERAQQTGFTDAALAGAPAKGVERAAEHVEEVLADTPQGGDTPTAEGGLEQQAALIDLFIRNEPMISPIQPDVERPAIKELAKESLVEDTSLITETMARIYAAQGQLGRARRAYKLLALKYPEKSVYFAAQSKKLGRKSSDD